MVSTKIFRFLLALAAFAIVSLFASSADAKVRQCMIGGVPHYTAGEDGQPISAVSWVEKGHVITLSYNTPDRKSVVEKKVRLPKTKVLAPKKVKADTQQKKQSNSKAKKIVKPAVNASAAVATFDPMKPHNFWSRLLHGVMWIITGEWNKPVTPAIAPAPATVKAVPPAKPLKERVRKRGPPAKKPCEQEIKVMKVVPALKPPMQTVAAPSCPPPGIPKPATGQADVEKPKGKLADWEVRLVTYRVFKNGRKQEIRKYLRSPAECYDKRTSDYDEKPGPGYDIAEDRYDRHTYAKTSEKPVKPGTVVHFALSEKPDKLVLDHIVREVDKDNMEIHDSESDRFIVVKKPEALKIAFPTEYHKTYEQVSISPVEQPEVFAEMYKNVKKGSG